MVPNKVDRRMFLGTTTVKTGYHQRNPLAGDMRSAVMQSGLINLKKYGDPGLTSFLVREFTFLF